MVEGFCEDCDGVGFWGWAGWILWECGVGGESCEGVGGELDERHLGIGTGLVFVWMRWKEVEALTCVHRARRIGKACFSNDCDWFKLGWHLQATILTLDSLDCD